jgi:NTE family protein
MLNGRLLADGGLMDPIPVSPLAALEAELTIAVSAGGEREGPATAAVSERAEARPVDEWIARFRQGAARALGIDLVRSILAERKVDEVAQADEEPGAEPGELPAGLTGFDVMNYSLAMMQTLVKDSDLRALRRTS